MGSCWRRDPRQDDGPRSVRGRQSANPRIVGGLAMLTSKDANRAFHSSGADPAKGSKRAANSFQDPPGALVRACQSTMSAFPQRLVLGNIHLVPLPPTLPCSVLPSPGKQLPPDGGSSDSEGRPSMPLSPQAQRRARQRATVATTTAGTPGWALERPRRASEAFSATDRAAFVLLAREFADTRARRDPDARTERMPGLNGRAAGTVPPGRHRAFSHATPAVRHSTCYEPIVTAQAVRHTRVLNRGARGIRDCRPA